jgi:hypothetical protein
MSAVSSLIVLLLSSAPVTVKFDGTLGQALKEIADQGQLNVMISGDLDETVSVRLNKVSPEDALNSVAKVYGLEVKKEGALLVLRRKGGVAAPLTISHGVIPPTPPTPPRLPALDPLTAANETPEEIEARADASEAQADALRERLDALEEARQAKNDALESLADAQQGVAEASEELRKNRVSQGGEVVVEENETVDTAVAYGGPVTIKKNGHVQGDAVAFGGNVVLEDNAVVQGDAVSFGGEVIRGRHAVVHGEVVSMGASSIGSAVAKNALRTQRAVDSVEEHESAFGSRVAWFLVNFALLFGLGFLLALLVPERMKLLDDNIRRDPVANGVVGLVGAVMAIPVTVFLCVTILGIPVALLMWMGIALAVPVSTVLVANVIGSKLPTGKVRKTQAVALGLGVLLILALKAIPYIGFLVVTPALLVAFGALLRTRLGTGPRSGLPSVDMSSAATV